MKHLQVIALTLTLTICQSLHAADFLFCEGLVKRIYVDTASRVMVYGTGPNDYTLICKLDTAVKRGLYRALQYLVRDPTRSIPRRDANASSIDYTSSATCADLPTQAASPAPVYVMARD